MSSINDIWQKTLDAIESEIPITSFKTWFNDTTMIHLDNKVAVIKAETEFQRDWLENHYSDLIQKKIYESIGEQPAVQVTTHDEVEKASPEEEVKDTSAHTQAYAPAQLNMNNTFETFVIGSGNRFSHAASLAVAEAPAKAYNPLFIYGGVGLGKTHLMHAIGHYVLEHNRMRKCPIYQVKNSPMNSSTPSVTT